MANVKAAFIALTIEENGKYYSYVLRVTESNNIIEALKIKGVIYGNLFLTKKDAAATVEYWNTMHKQNGKYLFDSPNF